MLASAALRTVYRCTFRFSCWETRALACRLPIHVSQLQRLATGRDVLKSRMPKNFSWVVENQVCAMGFPGSPENMLYLVENNVRYLISLTAERQPSVNSFPEITLFPVKVVDFTPPTLEQIDQCLDIIVRAMGEGKAVGVHCMQGKGRSAVVVTCLLVKLYNMAPDQAVAEIRRQRKCSMSTSQLLHAVARYHDNQTKSTRVDSRQTEGVT